MASEALQPANPQQPSPKTPPQKLQPSPVTPPAMQNTSVAHKKCICQMCTCGKHHCPKPRAKSIFQTAYQDHYKEFKYEPSSYPPLRQHQYETKHFNPDHLRSNYQENYVKVESPNVNKPYSREYPPRKSMPFIDQTEYKKNYQGAEGEQVSTPTRFGDVAKKMILSPTPGRKFNPTTSYNDHYKGYALDKPQQSLELIPEMLRSPVKFEGVTNYQSSYVPPPLTPSKPIPMEYHHVNIPFKGESSYKSQFVGYKYEPVRDVSAVPNFSPSPVKFEGKSSYQNDYDGKNLPKPTEVGSRPCVCESMSLPTTNYLDKSHMRFDPEKKQWV